MKYTKRRYIILLNLIFLIILQSVYSQSGWFVQYIGPIYNNIRSVYFVNESSGWISASKFYDISSTILKSTNGGSNWTVQYTSNTILYDIHFENASTGWTIGEDIYSFTGLILKTTNGGGNWVVQENFSEPLNSIDFFNLSTGWCAGDKGQIYKTTNGGLNWFSQGSDTNVYWECVKLKDAFNGWITGFNYETQTGIVIKTTNGGSKWDTLSLIQGMPLLLITFPDNFTGWLLGMMNVYKSTNGGNTWQSQYSWGYNSKMQFVNTSTGWITANSTTALVRTINGGLNWAIQQIPVYSSHLYFSQIFFINSQTGWCTGSNEDTTFIIKTTTGGNFIGVKHISSEIPNNYFLSQNIPNPFNPMTKIKFELPKSSFTKLIVCDVLGHEIETLVSEQLKPGEYEAEWNGSNYSSGIYFYKLITPDFTETKRMVLIK